MATQRLKVLITVKTAPIPSKKYDELVCTAGVLEDGTFVRLYPVNFRDLPYDEQYKKYQWVTVDAERHTGRDARKESWRPTSELELGDIISPEKDPTWSRRAAIVRPERAQSMEQLHDLQEVDNTSLGIVKPKIIHDLVISPDSESWNAGFISALKQQRLWDVRKQTKEPPRKMPWRFRYKFECHDSRCRGHEMMIEDWEVHRLYWRLVDEGNTPEQAATQVRQKFLETLCGKSRDVHFYVGTVLEYGTWVVIGVWWPARPKQEPQKRLF